MHKTVRPKGVFSSQSGLHYFIFELLRLQRCIIRRTLDRARQAVSSSSICFEPSASCTLCLTGTYESSFNLLTFIIKKKDLGVFTTLLQASEQSSLQHAAVNDMSTSYVLNSLTSLSFCLMSSPVSQSNSSLKKHRSRSIFSPFFCCFRNYNDYHVEPPPANNKTLSLPPPPEENGSPPKVKAVFLSHHAFVTAQMAQTLHSRDQKQNGKQIIWDRNPIWTRGIQ